MAALGEMQLPELADVAQYLAVGDCYMLTVGMRNTDKVLACCACIRDTTMLGTFAVQICAKPLSLSMPGCQIFDTTAYMHAC